ncbi:MAG: hypothetical protein Kow0089_10410 [Desulfobulbaceae bacterium]
MSRKNCWEFKGCGREPGGPKAEELGVCPASTTKPADGINGGRNGGRSCWVLAGTMCGGRVQGTFATKLANCLQCDFYKLVLSEEGKAFVQATEIMRRLNGTKSLE